MSDESPEALPTGEAPKRQRMEGTVRTIKGCGRDSRMLVVVLYGIVESVNKQLELGLDAEATGYVALGLLALAQRLESYLAGGT